MYARMTGRLPRVVAIMLAALLALAVLTPLASARGEKVRHDGRTLLQGLLLGSGPAAEQLPEVFGELPEMPDEARRAEALLLDTVADLHPELFDSFAKRVYSGDHVLVDEALNEGSKALLGTIAESDIVDELGLTPVPYHWRWLPFRWHFRFLPFRWTDVTWLDDHRWIDSYRHQYEFDYDGTLGYRYFVRWDTRLPEFEQFELDAESQLANERFVDIVVERIAH